MDELDQMQAALDAIPAPAAVPAEASAAADPAADDATTAATRYRVASNDTLDSIAAAHDTTADAILAANVGTLINDNLVVGQFIQVP